MKSEKMNQKDWVNIDRLWKAGMILLKMSRQLDSFPAQLDKNALGISLKFAEKAENMFLTPKKAVSPVRDLLIRQLLQFVVPFFQQFRNGEISYEFLRQSLLVGMSLYSSSIGMSPDQKIKILDEYLAQADEKSLRKIMDGGGTSNRTAGPVEAAYYLVGKLFGLSQRKIASIVKHKSYHEQLMETYKGLPPNIEELKLFILMRLFGLDETMAKEIHSEIENRRPAEADPFPRLKEYVAVLLKRETRKTLHLDRKKAVLRRS